MKMSLFTSVIIMYKFKPYLDVAKKLHFFGLYVGIIGFQHFTEPIM